MGVGGYQDDRGQGLNDALTFNLWIVKGLNVNLSITACRLSSREVGDNSQVVATFWEFRDQSVVNSPVLETGVHEYAKDVQTGDQGGGQPSGQAQQEKTQFHIGMIERTEKEGD